MIKKEGTFYYLRLAQVLMGITSCTSRWESSKNLSVSPTISVSIKPHQSKAEQCPVAEQSIPEC